MLTYGLFSVALIGLGTGVASWVILRSNNGTKLYANDSGRHDGGEKDESGVSVKAIHPKRDPGFGVTVLGLASVEAFFDADLRARVAGNVKFVAKDLGDPVTKGELLVEIDVPDRMQMVAKKEAAIIRGLKEVKLALSQVKTARTMLESALVNIDQRKNELSSAELHCRYRKLLYDRVARLSKDNAVTEAAAAEEELRYHESEVACESARIAIKKAHAEYKQKESSVESALADVEKQEALVDEARAERDLALAEANFARITAPFDGVVTSRTVDIGTFVQNATTAHTEPMIAIARSDMVTVVTKIPDNAAPFITRDTEVSILLDELPGIVLHGKVTRFSPSIQNKDRTMKIEVDLFNGTRGEYERFLAAEYAELLAPFGGTNAIDATALLVASRTVVGEHRKGKADRLPIFPEVTGANPGQHQLLPGMSGQMRLNLRHFQGAFLLPRSAVISRGGKPYIMEVKNGLTHLLPVRIQVEDGKLAKVAVIAREAGVPGGQDVMKELTGEEVILLNRQLEIGAGQHVNATIEKW